MTGICTPLSVQVGKKRKWFKKRRGRLPGKALPVPAITATNKQTERSIMRTLDDYPDGEFFARHVVAVPSFQEKTEIFAELCRVAELRGSPGLYDIMDYLNGVEMELLVTMVGKRFPIGDEELESTLRLFFLSSGESSSEYCNVPARPWHYCAPPT